MKKLKLNLSDLKVQSFSTNLEVSKQNGTVNAQAGDTDTCISDTICHTQIAAYTCDPNDSICPTECAYGNTNCDGTFCYSDECPSIEAACPTGETCYEKDSCMGFCSCFTQCVC
jgi:hypothetical protein